MGAEATGRRRCVCHGIALPRACRQTHRGTAPALAAAHHPPTGRNSPSPYPTPAPSASGPVTGIVHRTDRCTQG